jgi:hypothetical protein
VPTPEDRADAVFALPALPRRVHVLGQEGWREQLSRRGFETAEQADVVVVADSECAAALALNPKTVLVDGDPKAAVRLGRAGYESTKLFSLPVEGSPVVFSVLSAKRAARYAATRGIVHPERWRAARNSAVGLALRAGLPLPFKRLITIAARALDPPALLQAATDFGVDPCAEWVMQVSPGSIARRNAFLLFERGSAVPSLALKFARVRGMTASFDREDAGLKVVDRAGGEVRSHVPSRLGRFEVEGFHASLETAAVGERLSTYLRRPDRRRDRLAVVDRVFQWLIRVAGDTAQPSGSLEAERAWLVAEVLPRWGERLVPNVAEDLAHVPGTFQHHDLGEENIVVRRGEFRVLDVEWAQWPGLPLGDLVYFATHALRILDGVPDERRADHFLDLFAGRTQDSPLLFHHVRELVHTLGLPEASVGRLVTLTWVRRAEFSRRERLRSEQLIGRPLDPAAEELLADRWVSAPELGPGWSAWRR